MTIAEVDSAIIMELNQIKDRYRNPVIHPEENFGADEAMDLFDKSASAMTSVVLDIQKRCPRVPEAKGLGLLNLLSND